MLTETLNTTLESILMIVLTVAIPALLAVGAKYLNDFIQTKAQSVKSEYFQTMMAHIGDTIEDVVNHTSQTYVRELKDADKFDTEQQKKALRLSKAAAISMLNDEAITLIQQTHKDVNQWIETQIESVLKDQALLKS